MGLIGAPPPVGFVAACLFSRKKPVVCFYVGVAVITTGAILLYVRDLVPLNVSAIIVELTFIIVLISGAMAVRTEKDIDREYYPK